MDKVYVILEMDPGFSRKKVAEACTQALVLIT